MDREKVIKGLEICMNDNGHFDCPYYKEGQICDINSMLCDALELLKEQPRWIPVTERLPKSMANKVIVYLQHDDLVPQIGYGHYEKFQGEEMWYNLETDEQFTKRGYTVTNWMPMPKSPEGEKLALS